MDRTPEQRRRDRRRNLVLAVLFLALGGYSIVSGINLRNELQRQQECTVAYNETASRTSAARSKLVVRSERSFELLVADLFTATTPADGRRAYRKFQKRRAAITAARAENPVPIFSNSRCRDYLEEQAQ